MPIYKIENDELIELQHTTFAEERINEYNDLQKYIINSIKLVDPDLLVISTEFSDWENSKRRIDILCVDTEANLVVIELKRTEDGGHMELQAIRYSSMIANMTFEKAAKTYGKYLEKNGATDQKAEDELLNFFGWDEVLEDDFANDVRIILISANFSIELTTSILWLLEKGLDIRCIRIKPQEDNGSLYLDIQQIIPLPETSEYQVKLREKAAEERNARRERRRSKSIFTQLFEQGKIKAGDKVILQPGIDQGHERSKVTAEIIRSGQNCLQRAGDPKYYSFSRLRKVLTEELDLKGIRANWGFKLSSDWTTEDGTELHTLLERE